MIIVIGTGELSSVGLLLAALGRNGVTIAVQERTLLEPPRFDTTDWGNCNDYEPPPQKVADCDDLRWWLEERRAAAWAGIKNLLAWHARVLRPWLIIAKRFDFRSAPRWRAGRWKSKT